MGCDASPPRRAPAGRAERDYVTPKGQAREGGGLRYAAAGLENVDVLQTPVKYLIPTFLARAGQCWSGGMMLTEY